MLVQNMNLIRARHQKSRSKNTSDLIYIVGLSLKLDMTLALTFELI